MFTRMLTLLLCSMIAAAPVSAKNKKKQDKAKTETPAPKQSDYDKLLGKKHEVADGMVKLHKSTGNSISNFRSCSSTGRCSSVRSSPKPRIT